MKLHNISSRGNGFTPHLSLDCALHNLTEGVSKKGAGFTLVEILIAVAILLILLAMGLFLSLDLLKSRLFAADEDMFVSILHRARSRSLSNVNQHEHGVKLASGSFILFQGPGPNLTYATRVASRDEQFSINQTLVVSWPAPSEVVFDQLTGQVHSSFLTGNITMTGPQKTATVSFNPEGRIDW